MYINNPWPHATANLYINVCVYVGIYNAKCVIY